MYALDAQGNRTREVEKGIGNVQLSLDTRADQTVWYEVVAVETAAPDIADQFYYLVAQSSGLCADVRGGPSAMEDGIALQQWTCWGGDNQKWKLIPTGPETYEIVSKSSGKVLDVTGGPPAKADGIPIQQWSFLGGANQLWKLIPSGNALQVTAVNSGMCLDVRGGPTAVDNGIVLQQWSCWGGANQLWELIPAN